MDYLFMKNRRKEEQQEFFRETERQRILPLLLLRLGWMMWIFLNFIQDKKKALRYGLI